MTDPLLVGKRLAFIETCVADLRREARVELLGTDLRELRFVEHTLQLAIQAAIDVASHIVSDDKLGEPESNAGFFKLLEIAGYIAPSLGHVLVNMVGFRNVLVHEYTAVDLGIVRDVLQHRLDDLLEFVTAVRSRL